MKEILLLMLCLLLASCSWREAASTPLELFGGTQLAIDLGLKDANDPHIHTKLDTARKDIVASQEYRAACEIAAYAVCATQKPSVIGAAQAVVTMTKE